MKKLMMAVMLLVLPSMATDEIDWKGAVHEGRVRRDKEEAKKYRPYPVWTKEDKVPSLPKVTNKAVLSVINDKKFSDAFKKYNKDYFIKLGMPKEHLKWGVDWRWYTLVVWLKDNPDHARTILQFEYESETYAKTGRKVRWWTNYKMDRAEEGFIGYLQRKGR